MKSDGHAYVAMAARQGPAALVERPCEPPWCRSRCPTAAWPVHHADRFYGRPSRHLTLVGITGTNGKTTVSYLVEAILAQRGGSGLLGTVEMRYPGVRRASAMTTPESVSCRRPWPRCTPPGSREWP